MIEGGLAVIKDSRAARSNQRLTSIWRQGSGLVIGVKRQSGRLLEALNEEQIPAQTRRSQFVAHKREGEHSTDSSSPTAA